MKPGGGGWYLIPIFPASSCRSLWLRFSSTERPYLPIRVKEKAKRSINVHMEVVHQLHHHPPQKWDTYPLGKEISIPAISLFPSWAGLRPKGWTETAPRLSRISQFVYVNKVAPSEGNLSNHSGRIFWKHGDHARRICNGRELASRVP